MGRGNLQELFSPIYTLVLFCFWVIKPENDQNVIFWLLYLKGRRMYDGFPSIGLKLKTKLMTHTWLEFLALMNRVLITVLIKVRCDREKTVVIAKNDVLAH